MGSPPPQHRSGVFAFVKEAISGTRQDFTEGSLSRAIALLAIPMVLEMSMESLFGVVDAYFVNRVGKDAVATVVLTESVLILIFGVAIGLSISTTAFVARRMGEKNPEGAAHAAAQAIWLGVIVAVVTGIIGAWNAPRILRLMGASETIIQSGSGFTTLMLGGSVTIFLLFLLNAVFRGAGDASMALRSLIVANCINIALNPCLILGLGPFPELGVLGSAVATNIGRGTGVLYQLYSLVSGKGRLRVQKHHWQWDPALAWRMLRNSFSAMIQVQIGMASWNGMVRIMAMFGSEALAGYGLAVRTIVVAILPAFGMSNAVATLVGQNLGAGKPERAEKSIWITGFYNMIFLGFTALAFVTIPERIIGLYQPDPAIIPYGAACLRIVGYGYLLYAWGLVTVQAFNGAGDTRTPTMVNLFVYWVLQIPLAYLLAVKAGFGPNGLFWAITIAQCSLAMIGVVLVRRGRWKTVRI